MFFFNDTATTKIYTRPLHDALPISSPLSALQIDAAVDAGFVELPVDAAALVAASDPAAELRSEEHTSNSSHLVISYAVFCLKKKKQQPHPQSDCQLLDCVISATLYT